jgi:hypothetical protein
MFLEPESQNFKLGIAEVAQRLNVAASTLGGWLRADQERLPERRVFEFHRWRGRSRFWSEESFRQLERAIHRESQNGVLAGWRTRKSGGRLSPADPDAEASLEKVLGGRAVRI